MKDCVLRLRKEITLIQKDPVPHIIAIPLPDNILEWHYLIFGPTDTVYAGGQYHGKIKFPDSYPFKPPSIYMITPSGRFKPNTRLCLSMSDFHPETWDPVWSVSSILTGLLSFMLENASTVGSVSTSDAEKRRLAEASKAFNEADPVFKKLFTEKRVQEWSRKLASRAHPSSSSSSTSHPASTEDDDTDAEESQTVNEHGSITASQCAGTLDAATAVHKTDACRVSSDARPSLSSKPDEPLNPALVATVFVVVAVAIMTLSVYVVIKF